MMDTYESKISVSFSDMRHMLLSLSPSFTVALDSKLLNKGKIKETFYS